MASIGKNAGAQPEEEVQAETAQAEVQQADSQADAEQEEVQTVETQAEAKSDEKATRELPSQTDGYIIFVKDANTDEPLADVKVQFCSDTQCMMGKTDNTGATVFNVDPGNYQAHILKPPAGYQKSSETAELTAEDRVAVFKLLKEGEELKTADTADGADAKADETGEKSAGNESEDP